MINEEFCTQLLKHALSQGGNYADVFFEEKSPLSIFLEDDKVEKVTTGRSGGVGIRLIYNDKTYYAYTNELTRSTLMETAISVSKAIREKRDFNDSINLTRLRPEVDFAFMQSPETVPMEKKIQVVLTANKAARKGCDKARQVSINYRDMVQKVYIANSAGGFCEDIRPYTSLIIQVIAEGEGVIQSAMESVGGMDGFELIENTDIEALALNAARRAQMMLSASQIKGGRMPVVLSSEAGGTMIHEAIGHGLEADLVSEQVSVFADKLGEKVATHQITVIDNGTLPGKRGSYRFDDEGTVSKENVLVDKGVLKKYMNDRRTSIKEGEVELTGNGRRQSYQYRPIPRMTNTYLASGDDSPDDIIKGTDEGLFVKKMGGGQVNTLTGDFVFDVQEGYIIEKGEVGQPVRGATLSGNGPEVLSIIDAVGNDLGFAIGTCGKDGQGVPVSDALPTIRIPSIVVGGKA